MPDDEKTGRMPEPLMTSSVTVAAVLFSETVKLLAANGWEPIAGDSYPYWWRHAKLAEVGQCSISAALRYCWLAKENQKPDDLAPRIVGFLNELLAIDGAAIASLVETRVPCNEAMVAHPTVQTFYVTGSRVGMLGILNGLAGSPKTWPDAPDGFVPPGSIEAIFDGTDLVNFQIRPPEVKDE